MIKQSWNIDTEEVKRILMMHESATKNLYLVNEQIKKTQTIEPKTFDLPSQTFASGYHSENALSPSQKTQITNVLTQIADYLKQYKGIPMEIQLTTGESKPTNYDKENKKSLGTGELANLRGQTITRILTDFFNGLVQKGELPSMPKIPQFKTEIGKTPKGLDPNDPKYQEEQFIRFSVVASGEVTTECLVGLKIQFVYINESSPQIPCRGDHFCDEAVFAVYLNKTRVGTANLNNGGCQGRDCNRNSVVEVTPEMVNQIVNNPEFEKKKQLVLWYSCLAQNCHSSIPEIYIKDKNNKQLFPNTNFPSPCVATGSKKGDKGPWSLMVLDGCGIPIKMSVQATNEEMKAIQDEIAAEEAAKVKKKQDEDAKVAAEQVALQKQYIEVAQTQGFNFVKNALNTNVFTRTYNLQVLGQREEGEFYVVNLKNKQKYPTTIKYINDTIQNKVGQFSVPGNLEFIVRYPLIQFQYSKRKEKFIKNYSQATPVDGEQNYFYLTSDIENEKGVTIQGTKGSILKLIIQ
jgi:hypothetical protein